MDTALDLPNDYLFPLTSTDAEFYYLDKPSVYLNAFLSKPRHDKINHTTGSYKINHTTGSDKINLERTIVWNDIDWIDFALKNLDEVYDECSVENWDGYNAQPVSQDAYFEASKLLKIFPTSSISLPMPDIGPEPDGGIGLEWYKDKGFSFLVSINGKNIITYVGRFGKNKHFYGTEKYKDSVPEIILYGLKRLFSNS